MGVDSSTWSNDAQKGEMSSLLPGFKQIISSHNSEQYPHHTTASPHKNVINVIRPTNFVCGDVLCIFGTMYQISKHYLIEVYFMMFSKVNTKRSRTSDYTSKCSF
jgi:hypothetical protein